MATKPTPAQVAARKTFADMARAGAFKKAKRNPAVKKRAANPAKKTAPVGSQRIGSQIAKLVQAGLSLKDATAFVVNNELIKPRAEKLNNAVKYARQLLNYPDPLRVTKSGVVRRNPVGKVAVGGPLTVMRGAPKRNPAPHTRIAPPSAYAVHRALKSGEPGALLGKFATLALAKEYASAYATAHKCPVGIVGKK